MNETRLQIKAGQTEIIIKDLKVILNRLEEVMIKLQNNDKNLTENESLLKCLGRDHKLWSQGLEENIEEIKDMMFLS